MDEREIIRRRAKEARETLGLTQEEAAKRYPKAPNGCSPKFISGIETSGKAGHNTIKRLSQLYGRPEHWFYSPYTPDRNEQLNIPRPLLTLVRELQFRVRMLDHLEIPVIDVSKIPDDPFLEQPPIGYLRVFKTDIEGVDESVYESVMAIRMVSDIAEGFGICTNDYVILNRKPSRINGQLYMALLRNEIIISRMYWNGSNVRLEDASGKSTLADKSELTMYSSILLSGNWKRHWDTSGKTN